MKLKDMMLIIGALFLSPIPALAANWTGFYVGGQMMHGWGHTDWKFTSNGTTANHDTRGWAGGPFAGYNYQFSNNLVASAETEFNFGKIDGSTPCPNPSFKCYSEVTKAGSTRARVGYAFGPIMPYVTAGLAYGQAKIATSFAGQNFPDTKTYAGWTAGAGLEYALTNNFLARVTYSYEDLGSKTSTVDSSLKVKNSPTIHSLKFGIAFKF